MPVDQYKQYWDRYYQAIKNINDNDNIFDIIAVLCLLVTESGIHENVAINSYFIAMNVIEVDDDDECEREIESLFISRASVMSFKTYLLQYKYKKIFHPNLYCVKLILQIDIMCDQLFDITSIPLDTCIKIGPLNKNSRDILVYPKSKNDLYDRIGKQLKLRKTLMYQTGTLNAKLKHLLIIKRSCLDIKGVNHPVIYYLCDHDYIINEILQGKGIKIAIIPFCCRDAFSIYKDRSLFDIVNTTGTEEQYVIDRYIRLIRQCMDEQVHLVIFPELALTPAAYAAIRQYLASCTIPHHIQLIICGSMWHARNNTAYILSGQGDEICHYNKLVPYTHEDNDSSDQRQIFEENLGEREEFHSFIDINGFGRLYFSICLDYLTSQYEPYQKQFGASVFFVAAYTPSLAKFRTHAANLAEEYQSISVICNACSAIAYKRKEYQENNQIVGFISLTGKNDNERRNAVKFIDYQFDDCFDFCKANHAQCLKIMRINPMKIAQDQNGVRYADVQSYDAVVNIP